MSSHSTVPNAHTCDRETLNKAGDVGVWRLQLELRQQTRSIVAACTHRPCHGAHRLAAHQAATATRTATAHISGQATRLASQHFRRQPPAATEQFEPACQLV